MDWIIEKLNLDRRAQAEGLEQQWAVGQVEIITVDQAGIAALVSMQPLPKSAFIHG